MVMGKQILESVRLEVKSQIHIFFFSLGKGNIISLVLCFLFSTIVQIILILCKIVMKHVCKALKIVLASKSSINFRNYYY